MMALGALEAIRAAGRLGQVRVVGFDAVDEARREIAAGTMEASVAQNPELMGRLAVQSAVKLLRVQTAPDYSPVAIDLITQRSLAGAGPP